MFSSRIVSLVCDRVKTSLSVGHQSIFQVRTATKRAGGSRTHMKDSAGRRLGPKKHEGESVNVGEIIMRQRGTRWYPGENAGIGKDHTIFALEPGFVRYYLDPFHPKRKFIGVVLREGDKLPYPHFDARKRRFGRHLIKKPEAAKAELEFQSRKESQTLPELLKSVEERQQKREARLVQLKEQLSQFMELESEELKNLVAGRLLQIDRFLRGGKSQEDAQFHTTYNHLYDLKLQLRRNEISQEQYDILSSQYKSLAESVDSNIMFDAFFELCAYKTPEQIKSNQDAAIAELDKLVIPNQPRTKELKDQVYAILRSQDNCFTLSQQLALKRKYLKPVLPEVDGLVLHKPDKEAVAITRINYDTGRIETVYRPKEAFLP
ncbi:hypothetical protein KL933_000730 [Ogataea haglerorum]|uniref:Large ribosomal subunit protein bL27m n=1 Tax=Ogataea haglerorum TaxID=1937702 RepID=A0AAN6DBD3_9ASCO|nr:hypothetical protein KL915_000610 [Ogataea haglerorum]KAG7722215.1 hypothetical protein KL913_000035 [Ogataea haglerorum]KAG7723682.1 hypothetical protein KL949_000732 [Ogataea haglerorum]KAG7730935.1 hypothetical protein KL933_000730 [Ogataea haglerorum]KAG7743115.1 hypothetical protein KL923_000730 [Ogataea haglerorum]